MKPFAYEQSVLNNGPVKRINNRLRTLYNTGIRNLNLTKYTT